MIPIQIFAVLGLILSIYALKVEYRLKHNGKYKPICDINKSVSCSKAFLSKYGKIGGISNSLGGIFYYSLIFLLASHNLNSYLIPLIWFAFLGSILLAYLSYVKLKVFCVICNAIYIVNLILFVLAITQ